uniref:Uncharacterized protein n=1 Tax=Octopus bimaculoides TaxID=37653 RepID=A0A0L8FWG6_OCTBM
MNPQIKAILVEMIHMKLKCTLGFFKTFAYLTLQWSKLENNHTKFYFKTQRDICRASMEAKFFLLLLFFYVSWKLTIFLKQSLK